MTDIRLMIRGGFGPCATLHNFAPKNRGALHSAIIFFPKNFNDLIKMQKYVSGSSRLGAFFWGGGEAK